MFKKSRLLSIITLTLFAFILFGCDQKQEVPVYKVGEQVEFESGTILLNSDSTKTNTTIRLCFTLDLQSSSSFDELFAGYNIAVDRKGIDLRISNDESPSTNLKNNYSVDIDGEKIELTDLSTYEFSVGQVVIIFEFGTDYINSQTSNVSFTILNKKIGSEVAFNF